ncbi:MAG: C40 family peptidase [Ignavibacteriales bacterium]|nr:C40 family peptidase [Ignavibacteriales bacterium]
MTRTLLLGLLVLAIFVSCSASSNAQRYKKNKEKPAAPLKTHSKDTVKKSNSKNERIIFNDPADSSSTDDEFDEPPPAGTPIDKSKFAFNIDKLKEFSVVLTSREKVLLEVIKFLDTPYKYGGSTQNGIDCSAFTLQVFQSSLSIDLPRSAREQYSVGEKISKDDLRFGDLVFFNTRRASNPGHVGIYLGENQFVHASRSLGVTVSSLDEAYYKKRYIGARRVDQIEQ